VVGVGGRREVSPDGLGGLLVPLGKWGSRPVRTLAPTNLLWVHIVVTHLRTIALPALPYSSCHVVLPPVYGRGHTYIKVSPLRSGGPGGGGGDVGGGPGPTFVGGGKIVVGAILVGGDLDFIFNCGDVNLRMDGGG